MRGHVCDIVFIIFFQRNCVQYISGLVPHISEKPIVGQPSGPWHARLPDTGPKTVKAKLKKIQSLQGRNVPSILMACNRNETLERDMNVKKSGHSNVTGT